MKYIDVAAQKQDSFVVKTPEPTIFFLFNYSGRLSINISCAQANVYIFGLYIGKKDAQFKLHTTQQHSVGNSLSNLLIKGVFYDEAKFLYEGLIQIDKGAQKSNAYQKNQNLILGDKVFVDSRPFLEIQANDVRCTHGSTTGQLNKEQLLYVQSRGLQAADAQRLLVEGFVEDVFLRMAEVGAQEYTNNYKQAVLSALL